jgi:hypothetical protein
VWSTGLLEVLNRVLANTRWHEHANDHRRGRCLSSGGPGQTSRISRKHCASFTMIWNGEGALTAPFPSVAERFLFSGRSGHPPRRARRGSAGASASRGILARKPIATRPRFFPSPHRGPGEGTRGNGLGAHNSPQYLPRLRVAQVLSGPVSELFSSSQRIFFGSSRIQGWSSFLAPPGAWKGRQPVWNPRWALSFFE